VGCKDLRLNNLVLSGVTKRMKGCGWQVPVNIGIDIRGEERRLR
jgi:hypothetical protein